MWCPCKVVIRDGRMVVMQTRGPTQLIFVGLPEHYDVAMRIMREVDKQRDTMQTRGTFKELSDKRPKPKAKPKK